MSFKYVQYLLPVIVISCVFLFVQIRKRNKYASFLKKYWYVRYTRTHYLSFFFYLLSFIFGALALLDPKGEEKQIERSSQKTKTIMILDTSISMLAEDIRPNRLEKALFIAKDFIRRSDSSLVSLGVFTESYKSIVPFTDDRSLLMARIETISNTRITSGATDLVSAVNESMKAFQAFQKEEFKGNILLITDSDQTTDLNQKLEIPEHVNLAMVVVATRNGAPINIRDEKGSFLRKKTYKGETVITKINQDLIDKVKNEVKYSNSWIVSSYDLPTNQINQFFNMAHKKKSDEKNIDRYSPPLTEYFLIPSLCFLFLSFFFGLFRKYNRINAIFILFYISSMFDMNVPFLQRLKAQEIEQSDEKNKLPELDSETISLLEKMKKGKVNHQLKQKLAQKLIDQKRYKSANALYDELKSEGVELSNEELFNHATSKLESGDVLNGLNELNTMRNKKNDNISPELKKKIEQNMLKALSAAAASSSTKSQENQDDDQKKKEDQKQDQNKNKDQERKGKEQKSDMQKFNDQDNNKNKNENDDQENDSKNEDQKMNQQQSSQKNNEQKKKKKNKKDQKQDSDDNNDQSKDNEKKDKNEQAQSDDRDKNKKLPAQLKQLIDDDNNLQQKFIDAATKRQRIYDKDW